MMEPIWFEDLPTLYKDLEKYMVWWIVIGSNYLETTTYPLGLYLSRRDLTSFGPVTSSVLVHKISRDVWTKTGRNRRPQS